MIARRLGVIGLSVLALMVGSSGAARAAAADWDWHFNAVLGEKSMGADWRPFETYDHFGVESSWGKKDAPLMLATDLFHSSDSEDIGGATLDTTFWEIAPGLRKFWVLKKHFIPYFGLGLNYIQADADQAIGNSIDTDSDNTWGFWMGGGFLFRIGSHLNLGAAVRWEATKNFSIAGAERNGNATIYGLVIGWGSRIEAEK